MGKTFLRISSIFAILSAGALALAEPYEFKPPIKAKNFQDLVITILNYIVPAMTVFAIVAILFAGFRIVTAAMAGKPEEIKKARTMLVYALIGAALVVGATAIAKTIFTTIDQLYQ